MFHDLRFALSQIARHRWFSAAVVLTLALGIGINTTVFTLVNAVLFKPVPVPGGERLAVVLQQNAKNPRLRAPVSLPEYRAYREQSPSFAALEGVARDSAVLGEPGLPPERYQMGIVTPGLFGMLSTQPILGRGFTAADGAAGAPPGRAPRTRRLAETLRRGRRRPRTDRPRQRPARHDHRRHARGFPLP
jgi:hypothetical protein